MDDLALNSAVSQSLSSPSSSSLPGAAAQEPRRRIHRIVHVEIPPRLTTEEKAAHLQGYAAFNMVQDMEREYDEIVGEWSWNGEVFYYARLSGGIIRKLPKAAFTEKFPELVNAYLERRAAGEIEEFDPTKIPSQIHPLSRVSVTLKLPQRTRARTASSAVVSGDDTEQSDLGDDDDNFDDAATPPPRRSGRNTHQSTLPFSPKKTRSKKFYTIDESSDDDVTTRRSTRTRRGLKVNLADDYEEDEEEEEDDDDDEDEDEYEYSTSRRRAGKRNAPKKQARRKPSSRPAYGHFRPIADLECEADEDDAALRAHRDICEKCHHHPSHKRIDAAKRKKGKKKRKASEDDFDDVEDEVERITNAGGWVRCLKCPVTAHWGCLAKTQRDEILKAVRSKERVAWIMKNPEGDVDKDGPKKRPGLEIDETTEFICGACIKGGYCMSCMEVAIKPDESTQGAEEGSVKPTNVEPSSELLFRCFTCKRLSHYAELPPKIEDDDEVVQIAASYQKNWLCMDCSSYIYSLDKILAWRPYPATVVEEDPGRADYKSHLPREYLVKWEERGYRRTTWVPHMWLLSTSPGKLKNFVAGGSKVELLTANVEKLVIEEPAPIFGEVVEESSRESSSKPMPLLPQDPCPEAESRIPPAWQTVDRVLDVRLWKVVMMKKKKARKGRKKKAKRVDSDEDEDDDDMDVDETHFGPEYEAAFEHGEQPDEFLLETIEEWEERMGTKFSVNNIKLVVWAFCKWDELSYDQATWDSPPRPDDPKYPAFKSALGRFLSARNVEVKKLTTKDIELYESRPVNEYKRLHKIETADELQLGQAPELSLMPFQVEGFNWLCHNWWNKQPCILADEMGLGKTVQIATFIGKIASTWEAFPALVVVPNSTITNWVREFERWAPNLRVVPFYGEAKARDIIKTYELKHKHKSSTSTGAKFHVLITTYEALLGRDFGTVFRAQPRWEVLVIDEGQRLKSDSSLLFKKLNELKSMHRIIMTGTPLNNNIRELFNLMNFLDPDEWSDLVALEQEYEELTEELVKQLHERLRPYFLRRLKSQVLTLPPKNEVIVPVSMAPLQKEVYRSILTHNSDLLNNLGNGQTQTRSRINNILMQLRKCLQHPYLYSDEIEPRGLSVQESHEKLIDASTKLRFLKMLLPKLKARGHRVLLFSQFVIALNIIEDFLNGEGIKYLRLDGNTKGSERQKGMDEFNRPGSDVFIYLLTTRAGGVGINLFTADTVIIFDPDFNPHQDLQAIARAYRFGQKKTCLVFKLMVKQSAEERIVQVGKKKMVLDHLIVQKMDEDESVGENVQSILTFGAQALFDEGEAQDITYTDNDVDRLIEKTEQESGEQEEANKEGGMFSFAKIWTADRDTLEDVQDEADQGDSWANTLQKLNAERDRIKEAEEAKSGRGSKRKAAQLVKYSDVLESPVKVSKAKKRKSTESSDEDAAYDGSDLDSSDEEGDPNPDPAANDTNDKIKEPPQQKQAQSMDTRRCGLCGMEHGDGEGKCAMTESSENLAEYRLALLLHAGDEPIEDRRLAVNAIDAVLAKRQHTHLIAGQPLHLVEKQDVVAYPPKKKQKTHKAVANGATSSSAPKHRAQEAGPSHHTSVFDSNKPRASLPVAGSSKRASSPASMAAEPPKKKPKPAPPRETAYCELCGKMPFHPLTDCHLVTAGSKSVAREIKRLDELPRKAHVVDQLRTILKQQKRQAFADAIATDNVIELD